MHGFAANIARYTICFPYPSMRAQDIMTTRPITARESMTVAEIGQLLHDEDIRHVPIVRDSELVGIVSDRDLRSVTSLFWETGQPPPDQQLWNQPISELMSTDIVKIDPESEAAEIAELMVTHRISALPVVDPATNELVGIVSYVDLLKNWP